jgi:hypothetical protein
MNAPITCPTHGKPLVYVLARNSLACPECASGDDPQRWQSCDSKGRYRTEQKALRASRKHGLRLRVYRCSVCEHWHLTSKDKSPRHDGAEKRG